MRKVFVQYRWKWLVLLVPSWLLAVVMPSGIEGMQTTYLVIIMTWVTALCLALPVAGDYWHNRFERGLDWLFARLLKGQSKERAMVYGLWFFVLGMILWFMLIFLLIASPVGQILFFLGLIAALFFPVVSLFIQAARGGQHA